MQQHDVVEYLRANPAFLADHPGLYDILSPPVRLHGPVLTDHMAALLAQARARADRAEHAVTEAAVARRMAEGFTRRVNEAVLTLMRAPDPAWLAANELASLLHLDAARLCSEAGVPPPGVATIPRGTVAATLGQRRAMVRAAGTDTLLHGEAMALVEQEALVRVPCAAGPVLLALASRDASPDAGGLAGASTDVLAFLGEAVGAALDARPWDVRP